MTDMVIAAKNKEPERFCLAVKGFLFDNLASGEINENQTSASNPGKRWESILPTPTPRLPHMWHWDPKKCYKVKWESVGPTLP